MRDVCTTLSSISVMVQTSLQVLADEFVDVQNVQQALADRFAVSPKLLRMLAGEIA